MLAKGTIGSGAVVIPIIFSLLPFVQSFFVYPILHYFPRYFSLINIYTFSIKANTRPIFIQCLLKVP